MRNQNEPLQTQKNVLQPENGVSRLLLGGPGIAGAKYLL